MLCRLCKVEKDVSEFSKQPRNKSGYHYHCKEYHKRVYMKKRPKEETLVQVLDGFIVCKVCGRTLSKEQMIRQYGNSASEFQARCKDCDNIRKTFPDVWENRSNQRLILDTLEIIYSVRRN